MIITCNECSTSFSLDDSLIKPDGSKVRCSVCKNVFTAHASQKKSEAPAQDDVESIPDSAPALDEISGLEMEDKDFSFEDTDFDLDTEDEGGLPDQNEFEFETQEISSGTDEVSDDDFDDMEFEPLKEDDEPEEFSLSLEDSDPQPPLEESSGPSQEEFELEFDMDDDPADDLSIPDKDNDMPESGLEIMQEPDDQTMTLTLEDEEPQEDTLILEDDEPHEQSLSLESGEPDMNTESAEEDDESLDEITPEEDFSAYDEDLTRGATSNTGTDGHSSSLAKSAFTSTEKEEPSDEDSLLDKAGAGPLMEVDEKPLRKKKKSGVGLFVLLLVLMFLLVAGAYVASIMTGYKIPYLSDIKIPVLEQYLKKAAPPPPADLKPVPNESSVNGRFVSHTGNKTLFVITGRIDNPTGSALNYIEVQGTLSTKDTPAAKTKNVFCGNIISEDMLKSGDIEEISKLLEVREGANNSNVNIKPGASIPFMIVFYDLPDKLQNYYVKVVGFAKAP